MAKKIGKVKYLIIGNSAGGIGAVEAIRQVDKTGSVAIVSDEPYPVYSRPLISPFLAKERPFENIVYRPADFYEKNSIQTVLGVKVERLDLARHAIELADKQKIEYEKLLDLFWKNIDPTDAGGQFCDRGAEYRSAIFYHDEQQRIAAERSKEQVQKEFQEPVSTSVVTVASFTPAGEEHQDYYKKQPFRYKQYKMRCGREQRLRAIWK